MHVLTLVCADTDVQHSDIKEPALDLGVYKLAGNPQYETLLDALWKDDAAPTEFDANGNETCAATLSEALRNTAVIIVLDWERPWSFLESLERYMRIVRSSIERVLGDGNGDGALEIAACQARSMIVRIGECLSVLKRARFVIHPAASRSLHQGVRRTAEHRVQCSIIRRQPVHGSTRCDRRVCTSIATSIGIHLSTHAHSRISIRERGRTHRGCMRKGML